MLAPARSKAGSAQGIGYALLEEVVMRDGRMANAQLTNYIIPTTARHAADGRRDSREPLRARAVRRERRRRDADRRPGAGGHQRAAPRRRRLREIPATPEKIMNAAMRIHAERLAHAQRRRVDAHPMKRLLDVLREDCGLTGTKEGCGEGECGACTVLVDGAPVNSCLVPVAQVERHACDDDRRPERPHPLQAPFVEHGGAQCGICTPGMIMAAVALGPGADARGMRTGLAGNLCRCTGYAAIYRSIRAASPRRIAASARSAQEYGQARRQANEVDHA